MLEQLPEASVKHAGAGEMTGLETGLGVLPSVAAEVVPVAESAVPTGGRFTKNALVSVARLLLTTAVALVLPAYLTHKLPVKTYSAWVLILQMSAYVGYLDFGIQTGVSKFVAEYEARGDTAGASVRASAGLALMLVMSVVGVMLTLLLAWQVPRIFHEMPTALYRDVRLSLLAVGVALSFSLLCSVCSAVFLGLQRYTMPMVLSVVNRFLFTGAVFAAVYFHGSLAVMGLMVAAVNVVTGLLQVLMWRRMASHIRLSLAGLDWTVVRKMLTYCSALAVWTIGMLCVSGLDVTIVGKYDFAKTAFYSIATLPTNFMLSILGAAAGPLLPTLSAYNVHQGPRAMGDLLARATRYCVVLLMLSGLPLMVGGFWVLRWWVGASYATQAVGFLHILVLANLVRNVCLPYSSMLVATENQKVAIVGASAEALVNLTSSVYLVRHMGAIGVAYGTLLGSFVSVAMHFALSMHYTYGKFRISRARLLLSGILRPAMIAIPSIVTIPLWWQDAAPRLSAQAWLLWGASTVFLAWFGSVSGAERAGLLRMAGGRLSFSAG